jgi:hypothetical protein
MGPSWGPGTEQEESPSASMPDGGDIEAGRKRAASGESRVAMHTFYIPVFALRTRIEWCDVDLAHSRIKRRVVDCSTVEPAPLVLHLHLRL